MLNFLKVYNNLVHPNFMHLVQFLKLELQLTNGLFILINLLKFPATYFYSFSHWDCIFLKWKLGLEGI